MTSNELFEKVKLDTTYMNLDVLGCQKFEMILNGKTYTEKDLEVLEILKNNIIYFPLLLNDKGTKQISFNIPIFELEKIKEWLEK